MISAQEDGRPQASSATMNQKICCKGKKYDVVLHCHALDRNLFKVMKMLNDVGMLYLFSDAQTPPETGQAGETGESKETREKPQHAYPINKTQACQLVWRSAYLARKLGIGKEQTRQMAMNKHVGKNNELNEIIASLREKLSQQKGDKAMEESIQRKILRLESIRDEVKQIWSVAERNTEVCDSKLYSPPITMFGGEMEVKQKEIVAQFVRKQVLELDMKILQQSIMFLHELETGHCIVSLEQCYPSFMVYKELFKSIIGIAIYNRALSQTLAAKEESYHQGMGFAPENYIMCHHCRAVSLKTQAAGYQCELAASKIEGSMTPLGYEQISLFANYDCLFGGKGWNKLESGSNHTQDFWKYTHPYHLLHFETCKRFYCKNCQVKQNSIKREEPYPLPIEGKGRRDKCGFCRRECSCSRCKDLLQLNKMLGVYHAIGGSFEKEVLPEMMFLNMGSQRVYMQLVTFQQGQHNHSTKHPVKLEEAACQQLTFAEQVQQLEKQFLKRKGQMQAENSDEDAESVDSGQIYPSLQKMFSEMIALESDDEAPLVDSEGKVLSKQEEGQLVKSEEKVEEGQVMLDEGSSSPRE